MTKLEGPEWEQIKALRLKSIRFGIESLRANDQPGLRHFRHGSLLGRINELRVVGLFTSEEARDLSRDVKAANLAVYLALKAAGSESNQEEQLE